MIKAIYLIKNTINNKCYIGQSVDPIHRFSAHKSHARNGDAADAPGLYNAIRKYGENAFVLEILEWTEDYNAREKELIAEYNTLSPNGYNIMEGGNIPPTFYGEEHPNSRISEEDVDRIYWELKYGNLTEPEIGKLFNPPISQPTINNINWGNIRRRENEKYPLRTKHPYYLQEDDVADILWLLSNSSCTMEQIAQHYNCNPSSIKAINTGRNRFNPNIDYPVRKFRGSKSSQPVETILANRSTPAIDTQVEMGMCS